MSHDFIQILHERGFVHQMTDEDGLAGLLKAPGQRAYVGYDCTGPSLHVGHLLPTMALRWFQKCGHQPVVLLGGGTTKIGDPSGKDEARKMLTEKTIAENMASLRAGFARLLSFEGENAAIVVNNADWLDKLNYIEMLRAIAPHFSINRMLTMDSVKLRLEREQPLSFLEFNYMILQAYDFVELNKKYNVRLQMGGSDQWGNIIQGVELHRRIHAPETRAKHSQKESLKEELSANYDNEKKYADAGYVFGVTTPLITTSSGAKMGKTASGAVWLNADMLSPYDYWQFWRNTEDGDVIRFLKLFTELPLAQIREYEAWLGSAKINEAKIILATEATGLLHGREEAEKAARTAAETFAGSGVSIDLPTLEIEHSEYLKTIKVTDLIHRAGFAESKGDARRLITQGAVKIDDKQILAPDMFLPHSEFFNGADIAKLSVGKKKHALLKLININPMIGRQGHL